MTEKSPDAFRTISEAAAEIGVEAHVLRFWEQKFAQVKPVKRAGGRRYYRVRDIALLAGIRRLLREEGMTIKGVQRVLREKGVGHVSGLGTGAEPAERAAAAQDAPAAHEAPAARDVPEAPEAPLDALVRAAIPDDARLVLAPLPPRLSPEGPALDPAVLSAALGRLEAVRARL